MHDLMAKWKLTDKITDNAELEFRVCEALAPYITRPHENDFPFINGHRVEFKTTWRFPWQAGFGSYDVLTRMSDVTETYFICLLIKKRFILTDTWLEFGRMYQEKNGAITKLTPVKIWRDVVDAVSTKLISDAPRKIRNKGP